MGINNYLINLKKDKQLSYTFIYSLKLVILKTLNIYIKINLQKKFIRQSKSHAEVLILFVKKLDSLL